MTTPVETIADIVIPDTSLVRDATAFIREAEDDLLFDHSRRVFLFGALQGRRRDCNPTWSCSMSGRCSMTWAHRAVPHLETCASRSTAPTRPATSCCSAASMRPTPERSG